MIPVRRSKRLRKDDAALSSDEYAPMKIYEAGLFETKMVLNRKGDPTRTGFKEKQTNLSPPPNAARAIAIDVNRLLFDDLGDSDCGLLGKQLSHTGKAFVMQESVRLAATNDDRCKGGLLSSSTISFNKYAGVQEWCNDVLFLWVNLGAPQCDVVNEFVVHDEGCEFTWYGGSRMNDHTSVIQRLIRVGKSTFPNKKDDHNFSPSSSCGIILWCRNYIVGEKRFSPYTCLGRLSYSSHEPGSLPLFFTWNLVDYQHLEQHMDPKARVEIINAPGLLGRSNRAGMGPRPPPPSTGGKEPKYT